MQYMQRVQVHTNSSTTRTPIDKIAMQISLAVTRKACEFTNLMVFLAALGSMPNERNKNN